MHTQILWKNFNQIQRDQAFAAREESDDLAPGITDYFPKSVTYQFVHTVLYTIVPQFKCQTRMITNG